MKSLLYLAQQSERGIFMFLLTAILLGTLPFGYKRWKHKREFNRIRKEIIGLTGGDDSGFTYKRYRKNRGEFPIAYFGPNIITLSSIFFSILVEPEHSFQFGTFCFSIFFSILLIKDLFNFRKELKIDLHDIVSKSDLNYMMKYNPALEKQLSYHGYDKKRNGSSFLSIQNKEYIKKLTKVSSIIVHARKVKKGALYLKKAKNQFNEEEYESKKEQISKSRKKSEENIQEAVSWILFAVGIKKTPKEKENNLLDLKKNMEEIINEDLNKEKKKGMFLPAPILELQEVIRNSVDEDIKKQAEEALDVLNQLFEESKKRKNESSKEFIRMKQKAVIDTAWKEINKY